MKRLIEGVRQKLSEARFPFQDVDMQIDVDGYTVDCFFSGGALSKEDYLDFGMRMDAVADLNGRNVEQAVQEILAKNGIEVKTGSLSYDGSLGGTEDGIHVSLESANDLGRKTIKAIKVNVTFKA